MAARPYTLVRLGADLGLGRDDALPAGQAHDSERAAMIYQRESHGAGQAITDAIDRHVQAEHGNDEDDDGPAAALAPVG
ncbi:MAG: hypothetical protein ABJB47_02860 [Actinomycetota bacterium]